MLKSVPASRDGMKLESFKIDTVEEIDETQPRAMDLAQNLVRAGLAEVVSDEEAAAHVKGLAELSAPQAADRTEFLKGLEASDAEDRKLERAEKRQQAKRKKTGPAPTPPPPAKPAAKLEEPKAPPPAPAPVSPVPPADEIKVGAVVLHAERLGQRMTVERLEGELAECVWFGADNSGPFRDVFVVSSLVNAPIAES